ncbi:hypothetical protein LCGC14_2149190, partial [marine sediment metagenome]
PKAKAKAKPRPKARANLDAKTAERLRGLAEKMTSAIENKLGDRLTNTPKRQREAMSARIDGERLKRTQSALNALADLHETGEVPEVLAKVKTKKAVFDLLGTRLHSTGYYHIGDTGEPRTDTPESRALWELLTPKSDEAKAAEALRDKVEALQLTKIPGYFATPQAVIDRMLDYADIQPGHRVLEPSAGHGAILDAIKEAEPKATLEGFELNTQLREVLELKGYEVQGDFMQEPAGSDANSFDRVVMNPPFEKLQDIDHVRRAWDYLKPGGRLISIMSPGPFFRETKKAKSFREWFEQQGGEVHDIEAGAFKESGTGVTSKLVVLDKAPEGVEMFSITPQFAEKADAIEADLKARLAQVGISDSISLKLLDVIFDKEGAYVMGAKGRFANRTIEIALSTENKQWTLDHEIIHALRDLGLIRPAEWKALKRTALADKDLMASIRERYAGLELSEEKLTEEAIADMHADWTAGRLKANGFIRTAFGRIRDFLEALGNALRGAGFQSAGDIFRRIERGEVGRRQGLPPGKWQKDIRFVAAFHGSPHLFEEFKTSQIGSGEGVQAYGFGLYFAENPNVANSYKYDLNRNVLALRDVESAYIAAAKSFKESDVSIEKATKGMQQAYPDASEQQIDIALNEAYRHHGNLYEAEIPDEV